MQQLVSDLGGVIDQLNPLSRQNQIVFLVWLGSYVFLLGAVWRCGRRWMRLVFLTLVQILSVGLFVSQANIVILAIYLWQESLALAVGSMALSIWTFRERRRGRGPSSALDCRKSGGGVGRPVAEPVQPQAAGGAQRPILGAVDGGREPRVRRPTS